MIRWLTREPIGSSPLRRALLHPDPDVLLEIAGRFDATEAAGAAGLSRAFSDVVSSVRVGRTHKLTRPNRLQAPTELLARHVDATAGPAFELLDVGGSDGITTLDAVAQLQSALARPARATLLDPFIRLNRYRGGALVEYRTPDQSPVMVRCGPFALQLSSLDTSRDVVSRLLGRWYLGRRAAREAMPVDATISLVNPLVATDPRIEVLERDVLDYVPALANRYDAVRASNVLNRSYFSPAQIESALRNLHAYVRDGGVLLISRSREAGETEADHGTLWRKTAARFVTLARLGEGSEIADIVDAFAAGDPASAAGDLRRAAR